MDRPWIALYPDGVPAQVSTEGYQSLPDLIGQACRKHGQRRAAVFMGSDMSYTQLDRHADAVAAWIQAQGLPAGSHVAVMMPNVMAYLPVLVGVLRAGMVLVNVNPMYTASELRHQLEDEIGRAHV